MCLWKGLTMCIERRTSEEPDISFGKIRHLFLWLKWMLLKQEFVFGDCRWSSHCVGNTLMVIQQKLTESQLPARLCERVVESDCEMYLKGSFMQGNPVLLLSVEELISPLCFPSLKFLSSWAWLWNSSLELPVIFVTEWNTFTKVGLGCCGWGRGMTEPMVTL